MDSEPKKQLNSVDEFLDLIENKYAIRIRIEANNIPAPRIRGGLTYRSASLAGIFWEAVELYKNNRLYYHDVRKLVSAIKLQGAYEETEGLPKKYSECVDKYNNQLKQHQDLQKAFDNVSEAYEQLKKDKKGLEDKVVALQLENDTFKRR